MKKLVSGCGTGGIRTLERLRVARFQVGRQTAAQMHLGDVSTSVAEWATEPSGTGDEKAGVSEPATAQSRHTPREEFDPRSSPRTVERFWRHVDRGADGECWNWTGAVKKGGLPYGRIAICIRGLGIQHVEKAHRFSWLIHFGPIPAGLHVLHNCDNARCVNPSHLRLGTSADNHNEKIAKGRQATGEKCFNRFMRPRPEAPALPALTDAPASPQGHNQHSDRRRGSPLNGASTAAAHPVLIRSWRPSPLDRALRGAR